MFHIDANLDQEERWLGTNLPAHVKRRVAAMATLLQVFAPPGEVTVWGLAELAPTDFVASPHWTLPRLGHGALPATVDLRWACPDARAVNDRRFALALARDLGCALPGACELRSVEALEAHVAAGGAAASPDEAWVCKVPWSSAGRHRVHGRGRELERDTRVAAERLIGLAGAVTFEPWLDRICDVGVCGVVGDEVQVEPPHAIVTSPRGSFHGIDLAQSLLEVGEHDQLLVTAERVAHALQEAGYRGPFGIDAFVYRDGDRRRLQPLCEINARYTFGHVARALAARFAATRLGFGPSEPPHSVVLMRLARGPLKGWVA